MGIFVGTVKSVRDKTNASGAYLGVIAVGNDGTGPDIKAWFAAPTSVRHELAAGAEVHVNFVATGSGTGIVFLKRTTVLEIDGSKVKPPKADVNYSELGSFEAVFELMHRAKENLKRPAIRLKLPSGKAIKLYVAGPNSRIPGAINVVEDGRAYPNGDWYGRIDPDGSFTGGRVKPEGLVEILKALGEDPETVATAYGLATGRCCFCAKDLTDERSVKVGYGPVCAGNYGLPWGGKE